MVTYEVHMTSLTIFSARTSKQVCLLGTAILFVAGFCFSQPAISLSPTDGPPTTGLRISGSGFAPNAQIDIYFDRIRAECEHRRFDFLARRGERGGLCWLEQRQRLRAE